jgi:hypothetical protein
MRKVGTLVLLAVMAVASPAPALEVAEGKLSIAGFGGWGYGRTRGDNAFFVGDPEGNYENAQFSLALTAQPKDDVLVAGQIFFAPDGEVSLDWAFAEYRLHDLLRLRAGKVKNPFGLFMEVKDVGTLRPFFTLPYSIYGPGNFGAESYLGAGITGAWQSAGGWELGYDLFGGALEIPSFEPAEALLAGIPPYDFGAIAIEEEEARDVVGARISITPPVPGLELRLSGYTGEILEAGRPDPERVIAYGVSLQYALDRLQIRGELFRSEEGDAETNLAGYAEVAWSFLPQLQIAARFEQSRSEKEGLPSSSSLLEHTEEAIGLSYWPSPDLVFKASYHRIEGNRFALPELSEPDGSVDERTDLFLAGVQFAF